MPLAGLVLVGTRCVRPLMIREIQNFANAVGRDALIVRASDTPKHATYDVLLQGVNERLRQQLTFVLNKADHASNFEVGPLCQRLSYVDASSTHLNKHDGGPDREDRSSRTPIST